MYTKIKYQVWSDITIFESHARNVAAYLQSAAAPSADDFIIQPDYAHYHPTYIWNYNVCFSHTDL